VPNSLCISKKAHAIEWTCYTLLGILARLFLLSHIWSVPRKEAYFESTVHSHTLITEHTKIQPFQATKYLGLTPTNALLWFNKFLCGPSLRHQSNQVFKRRLVGNLLALGVHPRPFVELGRHGSTFLRWATELFEQLGNLGDRHALPPDENGHFLSAASRVAMETFISTFSFGLSRASRGTFTILSATSIPAMTFPNTV
jgi:hypothetical protein